MERVCNKCNKLLDQCIADEPRCKNCNGVEFRLISKEEYKAMIYWRKRRV